MINIIEFINKENLTLASVNALKESDFIISYKNDLKSLNELINSSAKIFYIDDFQDSSNNEIEFNLSLMSKLNVEACELAISKSSSNVALISNEYLKFGFSNLIYEVASKYSLELDINIYPTVSAIDYSSSIFGAPLDDFSIINFSNNLVPFSEFEKKIEYSIKANFILAIYNPISSKELFNRFIEISLESLSKETIVGIFDWKDNSKKIIRLGDLKENLLKTSSFLILGNRFTYDENDLMITHHPYLIKKEIISYTHDFFEKYLNNESPRGLDYDCEYLPCHKDMEACDFCYCPFYPCADPSTGGKWIKDKNVWSCVDCFWIHKEIPDKCIRDEIDKILTDIEDLNIKKEELLRVRRECLLKTFK